MSRNKSRLVVGRTTPVDDSSLLGLLNNTAGVYALIAYIDSEIMEAESEFNRAAERAVFEPSVAAWAAQKHGVREGLRRVRDRLEQLLDSGK